MSRQDVHRPSVIIPADYQYVALGYQKVEFGDVGAVLANREILNRHMERTGGTYSRHDHGGNCHICGAHCVYTVIFYHVPSNTYVRTGMDCADKLEWDSGAGEAFRANIENARLNQAGKAKARAVLTDKGLEAAYLIYESKADGKEEGIVSDIVSRLVQYGNMSEKQEKFLHKLVNDIASRAVREAARRLEHEAAKPFPVTNDRTMVRGKVLSVRKPGAYDPFQSYKMLVQHADGWKVWGSIPSSLMPVVAGDIVEFWAKLVPSQKDNKFGFFSRPTKAAKIQES